MDQLSRQGRLAAYGAGSRGLFCKSIFSTHIGKGAARNPDAAHYADVAKRIEASILGLALA